MGYYWTSLHNLPESPRGEVRDDRRVAVEIAIVRHDALVLGNLPG